MSAAGFLLGFLNVLRRDYPDCVCGGLVAGRGRRDIHAASALGLALDDQVADWAVNQMKGN